MSKNPDIRLVADAPATAATVATDADGNSRLALLMAPGTETDHYAADYANDVGLNVLDTMQRDGLVGAEATEAAVRVLLLAAAHLWWDITIAGRGTLVSTMLLAGLDELRDDLVTGAPAPDPAATRERLAGAARAGLRGDDAPPSDPANRPPLVVPPGTEGFARTMLAAFAPPPRQPDADGPPSAA